VARCFESSRPYRKEASGPLSVGVGDLHTPCIDVYPRRVATPARRINVTLDEEHAGKLAKLSDRTHIQEGTLARSLLFTALDEADPDAARITEILDSIPGAWERTQEGLGQAGRGEGTPLDELA
jgi:hypothetical protein